MGGFFVDVELEAGHVRLGVYEVDVGLEVDEAFGLGDLLDADVEVVECIFEDVLSAGVVYLFASAFVYFVVFVEGEVEFLVEFADVLTLVGILIYNFVLNLEPDLFVRLLDLELLPLFVVDLELALDQVFGIFLADVPVLGQQVDVLGLQIQVQVLDFVEPESADLEVFGELLDFLALEAQVVD